MYPMHISSIFSKNVILFNNEIIGLSSSGIHSDLNLNDMQIKAEPLEEEKYDEQYPVISMNRRIEVEQEDCGDSSEGIELSHVKNEIGIDKIESEEISIKDEQEGTIDHLK